MLVLEISHKENHDGRYFDPRRCQVMLVMELFGIA